MNVAVFIDNAFVSDWRVIREVEALAETGYTVIVYATKDSQYPSEETRKGVVVRRIISPEFFKILNKKAKEDFLKEVLKHDYDIVHCHDQYMLQAGVAYKQKYSKAILVYDSHELFYAWPVHHGIKDTLFVRLKSILARRYQIFKENKNIKLADYIITVNNSLAKLLQKRFKLNKLPLVIYNTSNIEDIPAERTTIRTQFNIPASTKIIVYFGTHLYKNGIGIERPIEQFANLKDVALLFISANDFGREYYKDIVKQKEIKNIFFKDFIIRKDIVSVLSSCDIGLVTTWDKKHLSYWYALDSKIFSYIMSELPVLATAQPEYHNFIEQYKIGVCVNADEKNAFVAGLQMLLNNYDYYKTNIKIAKSNFNWEKEKLKLIALYSEIQMSNLNN